MFNRILNTNFIKPAVIAISVVATAATIFTSRRRAFLDSLPIKRFHPLLSARSMENKIGLPTNSIRRLKQDYHGVMIHLSKNAPASVIDHIYKTTRNIPNSGGNADIVLRPRSSKIGVSLLEANVIHVDIDEENKSFVIPDLWPYGNYPYAMNPGGATNIGVHEFKNYIFRSMINCNPSSFPQFFQIYLNDTIIRPYINEIDYNGSTSIQIACDNHDTENLAEIISSFAEKMEKAGLQFLISDYLEGFTLDRSAPPATRVFSIWVKASNDFNQFVEEYNKEAALKPTA